MREEIKKKVVDENTNQREEKGIWKGHFFVIPSMWFNVALAAGEEKWNVESQRVCEEKQARIQWEEWGLGGSWPHDELAYLPKRFIFVSYFSFCRIWVNLQYLKGFLSDYCILNNFFKQLKMTQNLFLKLKTRTLMKWLSWELIFIRPSW
jgi:hypothetical protein